jgi:hypothetical protein
MYDIDEILLSEASNKKYIRNYIYGPAEADEATLHGILRGEQEDLEEHKIVESLAENTPPSSDLRSSAQREFDSGAELTADFVELSDDVCAQLQAYLDSMLIMIFEDILSYDFLYLELF